MTLALRISGGLTFALIWACSSNAGPRAVAPERPSPAAAVTQTPPELLRLEEGAVGPYLMPSPAGWVAAWAAPAPNHEDLTWHTATFGKDGRPLAVPRVLTDAPPGLSTLRLRALDANRGLIVGAFESEDSDPEDPSYGLTTVAITSAGTLLAGGTTLVQECDLVVWIDVVPLAGGALVAWAEDLGDHAELFATVVDTEGHRTSDLFAMHPNARAWQIVKHSNGAMLGVVTTDGNVDVVSVDPKGKPIAPLTLLDDHSAQSDIDLATFGDRVFVAFSDGRNLEPRLYSAWVSLDAGLHTDPKPMMEGYGAATLIGLGSTPEGVTVLWQNTSQEPDLVRLGRIDGDGRLTGEPLDIKLAGQSKSLDVSLPQLDATATGVVVMTPPCAARGSCKDHADVLELNSELRPEHRLTWPSRASADLVWDFQCGEAECAALSAEFGNPTRVRVLSTADAKRAFVNHHKTSITPMFDGRLQAVATTDELAAVAAAKVGEGTLVATLSAFDPNEPYRVPETPAPDGRLAPVQAQLRTRWFGAANGAPRGPSPEVENSISIRARSVAGIDLTAHGDQALLVWTAIDNPHPQVFVTLLDAQGRKVRQNMLTRQTGEVLAVAATAARDGYFYVGWVREEGENNAVYVARLSPILGRQSADTRIAATKGTVSRMELAVTKSGVVAVLAENDAGSEKLTWLTLNPTTLQTKAGAPNPITANRAPNDGQGDAKASRFSPRLVSWGEGFGLAWLESSQESSTARLLALDDAGNLVGETHFTAPGPAATLDLACSAECRLALTGENTTNNQGYLVTTSVPPGAPASVSPELKWVTRVLGTRSIHVAPATLWGSLFYSDARTAETTVRGPGKPASETKAGSARSSEPGAAANDAGRVGASAEGPSASLLFEATPRVR